MVIKVCGQKTELGQYLDQQIYQLVKNWYHGFTGYFFGRRGDFVSR
jgi:hypothetical protein